jgi:hypothetical protein
VENPLKGARRAGEVYRENRVLVWGWIAGLSGGEAALTTTAGFFALTSALFALFAPETRNKTVSV